MRRTGFPWLGAFTFTSSSARPPPLGPRDPHALPGPRRGFAITRQPPGIVLQAGDESQTNSGIRSLAPSIKPIYVILGEDKVGVDADAPPHGALL